jgi:hypothetical protein
MATTTLIKIKRGDSQYVEDDLLKLGEPALTMSTELSGTGNPQDGYTVADYNLRVGDGQTYGGVQFLNSMDSQTIPGTALNGVSTIRRKIESNKKELTSGEYTIYNRYLVLGGEGGASPTMFEWENQGVNRNISIVSDLDITSIHIFGKDSPLFPEYTSSSVQLVIPANSTNIEKVYYLGVSSFPFLDGMSLEDGLSTSDFPDTQIYFPTIYGPSTYYDSMYKEYSGFGISYIVSDIMDSNLTVYQKESFVINAVVIVPANDTAADASACTLVPSVFKQYNSGKFGTNCMEQYDNITEFGFPSYFQNDSYYMDYTNTDVDEATNIQYRPKRHLVYFDRDIGTTDYSVSIDVISYDGNSYQYPNLEVSKRLSNGFIIDNPSMSDRIKIKWAIYGN